MNALMAVVRVLATIVCGPMLLVGCVWILQSFNLLPGSFMTGHIQWAIYGAILAVAGASLVFWLNPKRS
jgi:hypothetical protein